MTTDQRNEATIRTAERTAGEAYRALSDVAISLSDGRITLAELPAIVTKLEAVSALAAQTLELARESANSASWLDLLRTGGPTLAQTIAALRDRKLEPSEARPLIPQIQEHIEQWHELKAQVEAASKTNVRAIKSA